MELETILNSGTSWGVEADKLNGNFGKVKNEINDNFKDVIANLQATG